MYLLSVLLLTSGALADVTTPTEPTAETGAATECAEGWVEGDACETEGGEEGTCDASGNCVIDGDDPGCGGGCSSLSTPLAAGGMTLLALGLLAARRRR